MAGARRRDAPTGWPVGVQKKPVLDPFGYRTLTRCGRSTLTPAAAHDELVFTMPGGSVVRLSNWRRAVFIPARARAGTSNRFRVHDLRHTAASLMIQAGYPPKMLQEILGHASITTTLDLRAPLPGRDGPLCRAPRQRGQ